MSKSLTYVLSFDIAGALPIDAKTYRVTLLVDREDGEALGEGDTPAIHAAADAVMTMHARLDRERARADAAEAKAKAFHDDWYQAKAEFGAASARVRRETDAANARAEAAEARHAYWFHYVEMVAYANGRRDAQAWCAQRPLPPMPPNPYDPETEARRAHAWSKGFAEEYPRARVYEAAIRGEEWRIMTEPLRVEMPVDAAVALLRERLAQAERERDEARMALEQARADAGCREGAGHG